MNRATISQWKCSFLEMVLLNFHCMCLCLVYMLAYFLCLSNAIINKGCVKVLALTSHHEL